MYAFTRPLGRENQTELLVRFAIGCWGMKWTVDVGQSPMGAG